MNPPLAPLPGQLPVPPVPTRVDVRFVRTAKGLGRPRTTEWMAVGPNIQAAALSKGSSVNVVPEQSDGPKHLVGHISHVVALHSDCTAYKVVSERAASELDKQGVVVYIRGKPNVTSASVLLQLLSCFGLCLSPGPAEPSRPLEYLVLETPDPDHHRMPRTRPPTPSAVMPEIVSPGTVITPSESSLDGLLRCSTEAA